MDKQKTLGSRISEIIDLRYIQVKNFSGIVNTVLRYKNPASANQYLGRLRDEMLYGLGTVPKSENQDNLDRTSKVLFVLGIPMDDKIIQMIKEKDQRFVYPPMDYKEIVQNLPLEYKVFLLTNYNRKYVDGSTNAIIISQFK